jgi:hypothetical protein
MLEREGTLDHGSRHELVRETAEADVHHRERRRGQPQITKRNRKDRAKRIHGHTMPRRYLQRSQVGTINL